MAEAIMAHARNEPKLTLGVGTFSEKQRDAILDELEVMKRNSPETEEFFNADRAEPFFVKNLENIQGDERDVIFISIGYGRDAHGKLTMTFGPLNRNGGERRLNVLISRSKVRCEVFSSITADDIDLGRSAARGVQVLKSYLAYAERGELDLPRPSERDFGSEFEEDVYWCLKEKGYIVDSQVGVAGFFIDLAIVDPERPGRYLLGIECDGASYHSARSARDRDRLREDLLRDRGWNIHRIWSTDWFQSRQEEIRRLVAAIKAAKKTTSASSLVG